jgi:hypothetical protein
MFNKEPCDGLRRWESSYTLLIPVLHTPYVSFLLLMLTSTLDYLFASDENIYHGLSQLRYLVVGFSHRRSRFDPRTMWDLQWKK